MSSHKSPESDNGSLLGRILKKNPDLVTRLVSAVALAPLALAIIWFGGLFFSLFVLIGALVLFWEWWAIVDQDKDAGAAPAGYVILVGVAALQYFLGTGWALGGVAVGGLAVFLLCGGDRPARWIGEGIVYCGLALVALTALRDSSHGVAIVLYIFFVVWGSDIAAYFCGRAIGGPKLWPAVSPNKTWSGAIGGVIVAAFAGLVVAWIAGAQGLIWLFFLAALLSAASQLGDLFESSLKRRFKVKDSSHLIPGHGGLLDRVDGLVFAAVAAMVVGLLFGGSLSDLGAGLVSG